MRKKEKEGIKEKITERKSGTVDTDKKTHRKERTYSKSKEKER